VTAPRRADATPRRLLPTVADLAHFLDRFFDVARYPDDPGGVYLPGDRPVSRLGLALEPWPGLGAWVRRTAADALFLHRPWTLRDGELPGRVGVLAYHLAFDERLTAGYNDRLAAALGMSALEVLGARDGRPLGMLGGVAPRSWAMFRGAVAETFGGAEEVRPPGRDVVRRVAVVGAMTESLVREAAGRGAEVYVTGQLRRPAHATVEETGMGVIAVGHARAERWGLRALAGVVRERWAAVEVVVAGNEE
jgi:putative NIF3 family GTP cyclohydrolase 1 type 2